MHVSLYVCMHVSHYSLSLSLCVSLSILHTHSERDRERARARERESDRVQEKARARESAHIKCAHLLDASLELIEAERVTVAIDSSYSLRLHPPTTRPSHTRTCVCVSE